MKKDPSAPKLFSIGHSNHELINLVRLLQEVGVTAVADVRSSPFSQRYPHFNRPELEARLRQHDIGYAFLGDLLGGRPGQPSLYDADGRVNYERTQAMPFFREGLKRLIQALEQHRIAMLCAEEDPLDCHRGLMIAPALVEQNIRPAHLRGNGSIDTTADLEERLLTETGVGAGILDGLFATMISNEERGEYLAEAYRRMARRKAFRRRVDEDSDGD